MLNRLFHKDYKLALFLVMSLAGLMILPGLLTYGMFFDGVTYASVSRNMAEGMGTFWSPFYTEVIAPEFNGHPPLALGLQALVFRLFGDSFVIEKIYGLSCFILVIVNATIFVDNLQACAL